MISDAIRAWLKADSTARTGGRTCWQRMSAVQASDGGDSKACFCFDPPPEIAESSAAAPGVFVVTIQEEPGGEMFGTRAKRGTEAVATVRVYGPKGFTNTALCEMAFDCWRSLDRANIQITGYDNWGVQAESPMDDKDNMRYPAYRFRVKLRFLEQ